MLFEKRVLFCKKSGISEIEARASLLKSPNLVVGTEIGAIYEDKGRWAATVFVPKVASPPFPPDNDNEEQDTLPKPKADDGPEGEEDSGPPSDEGGEDEPPKDKPKSDGPPKTDGKGGEGEVLSLLHQILDMLGMGGPEMPPGPGAGGPPPGPPHPPGMGGGPPMGPPPGAGGPPGMGGGPGSPHVQEVIHKRVLKPGEAPPGTTPVGAPSLASINSLTAVSRDKTASLTEARDQLENHFGPSGLHVRQLKRLEDESIAALLTRR